MDLVYGSLEVTGDFQLINIKELNYDRDFILSLAHPVLNLKSPDFTIQFPFIRRVLLRASLAPGEATCHFLSDTDLASAVANFSFDARSLKLEIRTRGGQSELQFLPK